MSFSDELRSLIAKKAEQLDVADALRQRQVREEERKESQLVARAAALVRDAFRPLVKEFGDVLEAAGAFVPGTVAVELRINPSSGANVSFRAQGGTGVFHVLLFAAATAEGRIELKAQCVLATKPAGPEVERHTQEPKAAWEELFNTDTADTAADDQYRLDGQSLVEIAPKSIAPDPASLAAEQWARAALKKIAEACVEAERKS